MANEVLRIGIISARPETSEPLCLLLQCHGVDVAEKQPLSAIDEEVCRRKDLHVWLVDLDEEDWHEGLDQLLDTAEIPVFINEQFALQRQSHPDFWVKKLIVRLGELVLEESEMPPAHAVRRSAPKVLEKPVQVASRRADFEAPFALWVLGASLGGPAALKRFLQALPETIPASFILAQHIDASFVPVLCKILEDYSFLRVRVGDSGPIEPGELILMPVERRVRLLPGGLMLATDEAWSGPYAPAIDDIMADVAAHWSDTGAVLFSGMGGDGLLGARVMREYGHPVWSQASESCACSAMPDEVAEAGLVTMRGDPEFLARSLQHTLAQATSDNRNVGRSWG